MARPGQKRKNPDMVLTILRAAFLAYVRVLLCLQGMYLGFWAWAFWPARGPHTQRWTRLGLTLLFTFRALAGDRGRGSAPAGPALGGGCRDPH
jgi:hypothetical protein